MRETRKTVHSSWLPVIAWTVLTAATFSALADPPAALEADVTLTALAASAEPVRSEALASFDLRLAVEAGPGQWFFHAEASTTPRSFGVAAWFPEINKDAGTALDGRGHGRVQLSEVYYEFAAGRGIWAAGLIDAPAYIDTSDIANDETRQFLAATFVNNPTIPLPDYSPGVAWRYPAADGRRGFTFLLQSSHGLADNEDASYRELVDFGEEAKGAFAALETDTEWSSLTWRLGAWGRKTRKPRRMEATEDTSRYGLYGVVDGHGETFAWNLRAGAADAGGSDLDAFFSAAAVIPTARGRLGMAAGRTLAGARHDDPGRRAGWHAEVYYRHRLSDVLAITPDIQYLRLERPALLGGDRVRRTLVAGVRVTGTL